MKYEVGDRVLLIHSGEEGEIVEIMNEKMVMVNVEGIEFPVFTDQIEFPYFRQFNEKSRRDNERKKAQKVYIDQIPREKKKQSPVKPENGVSFSLVPVYDSSQYDDKIAYFKVYLINQNNDSYRFRYTVFYKETSDFIVENDIRHQQDFYLHNIQMEEFNDIIKFQFDLSLSEPDDKKEKTVRHTLKVKAKMLFHKIDEMKKKNLPSVSFEILNRYPDKKTDGYFPLPEQPIFYKKNHQSEEAPRSVIDLHIDKIIDSHQGMSNFEILQIQLDYFEKYYRIAVENMQPGLIVIHGVGSGRLRDEIHERLRSKKEVKSFVNQYHPAFGFGATEIFFQY